MSVTMSYMKQVSLEPTFNKKAVLSPVQPDRELTG